MANPDNFYTQNGLPQLGFEDASMPIAIIGVGGRFPGEASSPEKLWDLVSKGRSALKEVPKDRFNIDAFYHPHNERQGTINLRKAHFMDQDVSKFDAPFFSITPAEANAMDPQHRMMLECTYEALENAGQRLEDVMGSKTSCYVGCFTQDYSDMIRFGGGDVPLYHGTGTGLAMLSNRVSWFFNFKGPSISLDTACSSSLVALHLGCQSLRTGESEMSIIGGTNLMLMPDIMSAMTSLHFLSPDGKSQSFDHKANGYSRGEGAAAVLLKPLHMALRDNDVIRAVIRGTGINQDGNTPGITLPSAAAQERLIRETYASAGLGFADTAYVEAHGTGTSAGDPVEASALSATIGMSHSENDPVYIGSVKTNIGHLEGASGLAQVVKCIYALEKGEIPPNLWFEKQNEQINLQNLHLTVPTKLVSWPKPGLRRASINSFGYGGTNAHCIMDDAYHYLQARRLKGNHVTRKGPYDESPGNSTESAVALTPPASDQISLLPKRLGALHELENIYFSGHEKQPMLFAWSSHEQLGIERTAKMYADYVSSKDEELLDSNQNSFLGSFAYTLSARRSILPWKSFTIASTTAELGENLIDSSHKPTRSSACPSLAYVFTGQGAQWFGMGRELFVHEVFRESLKAADAYFTSLGSSWSLIPELMQDEKSSRLHLAALGQPICTAVQVALVDLMTHWRLSPSAVVGHSSGEIAAAYAKGAVSREDAWLIAYHRGRLSSSIPELAPHLKGSMMAVGLGLKNIQSYLADVTNGSIVIACINSPASTTLSGESASIEQLEEILKKDGHFARRLKVDTAYHSPHMEVIAKQYLESLADMTPKSEGDNNVKMFSSVTASLINNTDLGPSYWVSNLLNPVNFLGALQSLCNVSENGQTGSAVKPCADIFIEIGPHSALEGPIKQTLSSNPSTARLSYLSVLRRGKSASITALEAVGQLFCYGCPVDISRVNNVLVRPKYLSYLVDLPAFSWNRHLKYWFETQAAVNHRFAKNPRKDLLGALTLEGVDMDPRWQHVIRISEAPWVEFHKVQGTILYPAAGMMIAAIEAAKQRADPNREIEGFELRDILIGKAIVVPADDPGVEMILSLRPWRMGSRETTSTWQEFSIFSRQDSWDKNCSGLLRIKYKEFTNQLFFDEDKEEDRLAREAYFQTAEECIKPQNTRTFYEHLASIGLRYDDVFQTLVNIRQGHAEKVQKSACTLQVPDTRSRMPMKFEYEHVIHPATLDGLLHMAFAASGSDRMSETRVPTSIDRLYVSHDVPSIPGTLLHGHARVEAKGFDDHEADIFVSTPDWEKPLIIFNGVKTKPFAGFQDSTTDAASIRKLVSYLHWREDVSMLSKEDITDICTSWSKQLRPISPENIAELELGAFIIMKRVLATVSPEEAQGFAPHLHSLYEYMQRTYDLATQGKIVHQQATSNVDWLNTSPEFEDELLNRVSKGSADGVAMCQHGNNMVNILRGEKLPLEVLMKDNLLQNFYSDGVGFPQSNSQIASYIQLLAHKNPRMKILEIGAGTGGATLPVLKVLGGQDGTSPLFDHYTFTDISSGFFEKAQVNFKPWAPFMTYTRLNIEKDPLEQGFTEGSFDLIIAANVLHATPQIKHTLENVKKLLKPAGKLVLTEATRPHLRVTMIVGSLEGWWVGEADGRKWTPLLSEAQWNDELREAGFSGVDICLPDWTNPRDHFLSVLVSSASEIEAEIAPAEVLIVEPESPTNELRILSGNLEAGLCSRGAKVTVATLKDLPSTDVMKNKSCLSLLECDSETPFLSDISVENWDVLKKIILQSADITWVSRGATNLSEAPFANLMTGMARSIRAENYHLAFTSLDLDAQKPIDSSINTEKIMDIFIQGANSKDSARPDWEYAIRNDRPMVQRILLEKGMNDLITSHNVAPTAKDLPFKQEGRPLKLSVGTPGRLDTLQFVDDPNSQETLNKDDVEIEVKSVGLNFKDIMIAMGQLQQSLLGLDCSGIVTRVGHGVSNLRVGDKVLTWGPGAFSNFLRSPECMVHKIPDRINFSTAASLPVVYSTAHYALSYAARLLPGESILIHGAAGGVGQAAIILAQHIGAEIFATVSSEAKKSLLMQNFNIKEDHIFSSRDTHFAQGIKRMSNGKGVDVVLNSLAGEALQQSWNCIRSFGRFIEMGQKDIVGNTGLEMTPFIRNVSFHSINMIVLLEENIYLASRVFAEVVDLLEKGIVQPIQPLVSMPLSKIEEAFRLMQTGQHMGKIVLETVDDQLVPCMPPKVASFHFRSDATYVLSGGSGGIGRSIARWMVQQGARNIVFFSRSGLKKREVQELINTLQKQGAKATAYACDVSNEADMAWAVEQMRDKFPPVKGVIQAAMVLNDSIYQNMTHEQFMGATLPKVQGSWNLHKYLPQDMDFYVLLSSSAGVAGSRGQGNYSAGNAFQDALAHYRRLSGQHAVSMDVGVVLGVGFLADTTEERVHDNTKNWSFIGIRETELHAMVQAAITGVSIEGQCVPTQFIIGLGTGGMAAYNKEKYPWWFNDSKFAHLVQVDTHKVVELQDEDLGDIQTRLARVTNMESATEIVCEALVAKLAKSMMIPTEDIEDTRPANSYGIDSLLAVELRSWIFTVIQADVSIFDLLSNIAINSLSRQIVAKSKLIPEEVARVVETNT